MTHNQTKCQTDPDAQAQRERRYRRAYWAEYRKRKKRIFGTLDPTEHQAIEVIAGAHGRSVWAQIWAESCAYRQQAYVPTTEIEQHIETLHAELRCIGVNLNQLAKTGNIFGRLKRPTEIAARLEELEQAVADFTAKPWGAARQNDDVSAADKSGQNNLTNCR